MAEDMGKLLYIIGSAIEEKERELKDLRSILNAIQELRALRAGKIP